MSLMKRTSLMPWVDRFFADDDFINRWWKEDRLPAVNVAETEKDFKVEVAAPGMKKDDFKVEVKEGTLYISAETKAEKEEKEDNYMRKEFSFSSFKRSFYLPENVKEDEILANYKDGILYLTLPKVKVEKKEKVKKIEIK